MDMPEYFTVELSSEYNVTETPEIEGWIPEKTHYELCEVTRMNFSSEISLNEIYSNIDSIVEDGVEYVYSIKLGAFTWFNDEYTLEQTFDTMREVYQDLEKYCMDEKMDFIYRPYVLIESREPSHSQLYDTLEEKYM